MSETKDSIVREEFLSYKDRQELLDIAKFISDQVTIKNLTGEEETKYRDEMQTYLTADNNKQWKRLNQSYRAIIV